MIPNPIREGMQAKSRRLLSLDRINSNQVSVSSRATAQLKVIKFLSEKKSPISATEVIKHTSTSPNTISSLVKKGLILESSEIIDRTAYDDEFMDSADQVEHSITLNTEQLKAVKEIKKTCLKCPSKLDSSME